MAGGSCLDRLQKKAQNDELDHTNTSAAFFIFLSAIQLPIALVASIYFLNQFGDFSLPAIVGIGAHVVGFALSILTGTDMFFDITGEITFGVILLYTYFSIPNPSPRQKIAFTLSGMWVIRLGYFLFARIVRRGGRDWRFDKLVKGRAYNFFGWVCQGTWIWLNGFCLWVLAATDSGTKAPLTTLDYVGAWVFLVGFACECIADEQKSAWNARMRFGHDKQNKWINEGLWKFSRHPNFFGEMFLWFGLAILSVNGLGGCPVHVILAFVSPVWSCFFLVFTSLMLLEKRMDKKFEGQPEYEAYKARTSVLVPWAPGQ